MMEIHLVGGFLGSGKTTAIIGAARALMSHGKVVGIITNDQGKYLVDTAFVRAKGIPSVEITGGCFCCNYDDLDVQLRQLKTSALPDVIFAESVGSCADVVATVIKPFQQLNRLDHPLTSYSVFTDARLLRRRLRGLPMPFGDNVTFIFDKQIEETNLLVLNKIDLLSTSEANELKVLASTLLPGKVLLTLNSHTELSISQWLDTLKSDHSLLPHRSVAINYDRYAAGEAELAWLDEVIAIDSNSTPMREVLLQLIECIQSHVNKSGHPIGHLKFFISGPDQQVKISLPALDELLRGDDIPEINTNHCEVIINARVQTSSEQLKDCVGAAINMTMAKTGARYQVVDIAHFNPGYPHPTHRFA